MVRHTLRWQVLVLLAGLFGLLSMFMLGTGATRSPLLPFEPQTSVRPSALTDTQGRFQFAGLSSSSHLRVTNGVKLVLHPFVSVRVSVAVK